MNDLDDRLRESRPRPRGRADTAIPSFEAVWSRAERRYRTARPRRRWAAVAALAGVAVLAALWLPRPANEADSYIEVAELLETTRWQAPSDALLPQSRFDIYQELPVLLESTQPAGEALL